MTGRHHEAVVGSYGRGRLSVRPRREPAEPTPREHLLDDLRKCFGPARGQQIFQLVWREFGHEARGQAA